MVFSYCVHFFPYKSTVLFSIYNNLGQERVNNLQEFVNNVYATISGMQ